MSKNTKKVPLYIIIGVSAGFSLKYASAIFQLISLWILIIIFIYEIINLTKRSKKNDKVGIVMSFIIDGILMLIVAFGKSYFNMRDNLQLIILFIAFVEFF